jgi:hypothetical protein
MPFPKVCLPPIHIALGRAATIRIRGGRKVFVDTPEARLNVRFLWPSSPVNLKYRVMYSNDSSKIGLVHDRRVPFDAEITGANVRAREVAQ